jgi:hypothetical protein
LSTEPPPLFPDGNALVRSLVGRQRQREAALGRYTYDVESAREQLDPHGRTTRRQTERHEVFFIRGREVRRLVAENGHTLSAARQAREDRDVKAKVAAITRGAVITEQPLSRLSALLLRHDFRAVGWETVAGRRAIVLEFSARPGAAPVPGDALPGDLEGRLWVDEEDTQICRTELRNAAAIRLGKGVGAKLQTLVSRWQFAKVDDTLWLPLSEELLAEGRALVWKRFRVRLLRRYGRFRVFGAESDEAIAPPR